jgi:nicotinamidase-related amidase
MINRVIQMFREHGFPVIRVYNTDLQHGPKPDTEAFEFLSSVEIRPQDPKIVKNYPNAFKRTELDQWLRREGCNTLFLCGLNAVYCVLATYHGAADLDYDVFLVKDAVMSHNPGYTRFVEDILSAVGLKALAIILEQAREKR